MKKIIFVCSGNTCRSPMAEGIFNARAGNSGFYALSCGVSADSAMPAPASYGARGAALKYGADLEGHISKRISPDILKDASLIVCMTKAHARAVRTLFPECVHIIRTLAPQDILDPFGGNEKEYERCAEMINEAISRLISTLVDENGN